MREREWSRGECRVENGEAGVKSAGCKHGAKK